MFVFFCSPIDNQCFGPLFDSVPSCFGRADLANCCEIKVKVHGWQTAWVNRLQANSTHRVNYDISNITTVIFSLMYVNNQTTNHHTR